MLALIPHVALQLALCNSIAKVPADTMVAYHVRMAFHAGDPPLDRVFKVERGDDPSTFIEFNIDQGLYRLSVEAPAYGCSFNEFVSILPDQNRKIVGTLVSGTPPSPGPELLMDGIAPTSFLYTKPTYVFIDKTIACGQPVGTPTVAPIEYEYDQGAYYLWMHDDPAFDGQSPTIALRLRTTTGLAHYVRIPLQYSMIGLGWPGSVRLDISEDMIDGLATEKTATLLCPKIWETRVG